MSKETLLKKEFSESDLARIRNLTTGRYGEKTKTQTGYTSQKIEYKEGDIWEENDKTWTIKDGLKQTITKFDKLKKILHYPLTCPNCKTHFKISELNKKMYNIHGTCSDCVFEMETKLKLEGKFEEYERKLMNSNRNSLLDELEVALEEYSNSTNDSFITEDGVKETWLGGGIDREFIKKIKEQIKEQKSKTI